MIIIIFSILTISFLTIQAQNQSYNQEIEAFKKNLNEESLNTNESPLTKK
jgi:hypothetical protein